MVKHDLRITHILVYFSISFWEKLLTSSNLVLYDVYLDDSTWGDCFMGPESRKSYKWILMREATTLLCDSQSSITNTMWSAEMRNRSNFFVSALYTGVYYVHSRLPFLQIIVRLITISVSQTFFFFSVSLFFKRSSIYSWANRSDRD